MGARGLPTRLGFGKKAYRPSQIGTKISFLHQVKSPPVSQSSLSSARGRESSGWRGALYLMLERDFRTYLARSVRFLPAVHLKGAARAAGDNAKRVIKCMCFPTIFIPFSVYSFSGRFARPQPRFPCELGVNGASGR